jgi:hypothetical protein
VKEQGRGGLSLTRACEIAQHLGTRLCPNLLFQHYEENFHVMFYEYSADH